MPEPIRYVAGTIELSEQAHRNAIALERVWNDILTGRIDWDPSKVDWDALEEMWEDA